MGALILLAMPAQAQRIALVIGNAAYAEKPLRNPVNDAQDVAAELRRNGFAVTQRTNLDRRGLNETLRQFTTQANSAQLVVVYYSGHGMQTGGENYLIPTDARINDERDIRSEGISLAHILADLDDARVQRTVVILDACRDNPYQTRARSAKKGLARVEATGNATVVAFATAEGKTADDGVGRNGVYTTALLGQLRQAPQDIRDLLDETANAVVRQTRDQKPKVYGDTGAFKGVYLAGIAPAPRADTRPDAPAATALADPEEEAWAEVKDSQNVAALEVVLQQFPSGRYATRIRARLAALKVPAQVAAAPRLDSAPAASTVRALSAFKDCPDCPDMVVIPAGSFTMGSNESDTERPPHGVNIRSFAIGRTEVTQGQWQAVMGSNPSRFDNCGNDCPVEQVSWSDVQQFIQRLNARTGKTYRLPSEAEWEYAANAGSTGRWSFGDNEGQLGQHAWFGANSDGSTQRVAQKQPNAFGLYDMHGNVWEWVEDCWHNNYNGAPTDGSAWTTGCSGDSRVLRGGSWIDVPPDLRSAIRGGVTPVNRSVSDGFRLARTLVTP